MMESYDYYEQYSKQVWNIDANSLHMIVSNKSNAVRKIKESEVNACLYLLISKKEREIYVGESADTVKRIGNHLNKGPQIKNKEYKFNQIAIIWDGKTSGKTKFAHNTIRKELETLLTNKFRADKMFTPVNNSSNKTKATDSDKIAIDELKHKIFFMLYKFGYLKEIQSTSSSIKSTSKSSNPFQISFPNTRIGNSVMGNIPHNAIEEYISNRKYKGRDNGAYKSAIKHFVEESNKSTSVGLSVKKVFQNSAKRRCLAKITQKRDAGIVSNFIRWLEDNENY